MPWPLPRPERGRSSWACKVAGLPKEPASSWWPSDAWGRAALVPQQGHGSVCATVHVSPSSPTNLNCLKHTGHNNPLRWRHISRRTDGEMPNQEDSDSCFWVRVFWENCKMNTTLPFGSTYLNFFFKSVFIDYVITVFPIFPPSPLHPAHPNPPASHP